MEVDIPEWGGKALIRAMSAGDRDRFETYVTTFKSKDIRARLAVSVLCDADGKLLFTEEDMPAISQLHAKALDRIFEAAIPFNSIGVADVAALKKNSSPTPPDDSSSSSPVISEKLSAS